MATSVKSERFEMRVDEELLTKVDGWRAQQEDVPSRAEAMRRLVEIGLGRNYVEREAVKLSDGEKLLALMMRDIHKHLKINGEIDSELVAKTVYGGHYWALDMEMQGLFHRHVDDPRNVRFVVDVLDMWNFIETGYAKLPKQDKTRVETEVGPLGKHVKFIGFDGNNETEHMSIAQFLIDELNKFSRFKGRDFNSHVPRISHYQRMLNVFLPIRKNLIGVELNADQVISILKS